MRKSRWTRTAACAVLLGAAVLAPTSAHALVPGGRASDTGRIWALDPTFSDDGVASFHVTSDPRESDSADDVVVQPDGKIVLAGDHLDYDFEGPETEGIGVVRLNPDGTLDETFGEGGVEMISLGPADNFGDLALQLINGQTKIIVSGSSDGCNFVLRLNSDGALDEPSVVATAMRLRAGAATTVTIQPSGNDYRIVIGGWKSRDRGYVVWRLDADHPMTVPALAKSTGPPLARTRPRGSNSGSWSVDAIGTVRRTYDSASRVISRSASDRLRTLGTRPRWTPKVASSWWDPPRRRRESTRRWQQRG